MGFKRTSEGRVFFQSPDGSANDQPVNTKPKTKGPNTKGPSAAEQAPLNLGQDNAAPKLGLSAGQSSPQTQIQIVALLKTLNERLKLTQAERDKFAAELQTTKGMIEDLQKKSLQNEKAYKALQGKIGQGGGVDTSHAEMLARDALEELEETRKHLLNLETKANRADAGVSALKKLQVEQAEKMAVSINHAAALTKRVKDTESRQEQIDTRVEDALSQQARLSRKIEKAVEERTRFMRKLERIEETVLQTRDSLNAKAMVLLTDQGVAAQEHMSAHDAQLDPETIQLNQPVHDQGIFNQPKTLQAIGAGLFVLAGILGGWLVYELQKPTTQGSGYVEQAQIEPGISSGAFQGEPTPLNPTDYRQAPTDMAEMQWEIETDTSAFDGGVSASIAAAPQQIQTANDDIGTLDLNNQAQVEALLDDKPEQVASAINTIEPGNALPQNIIAPDSASAPEPASTAPEAAATQPAAGNPVQEVAKASVPVKTVAAPAMAVQDPGKLIKPDGNLPEAVKSIEAQAFDGDSKAQHDLAAIYTAGHGGVKQDYNRAAFWFEQAASRDVANAAYNLGVLNHQGLGVQSDLEKAIGWYSHAAKLNHPEAQYNLGIAYIEGIGVPYDAQKASEYFANAAGNGIMEAAYNLGLIYENGLLGSAQPDDALVWYKTAADQGSPEAKQALQQLAQSLGVSVDDVNSLAESMKTPEQPVAVQSVVTQNTASVQAPQFSQQALTAQVQDYLMRLGLYPGPADGITGPLTKDAIRSYQRQHNLNPDGQANEALLSHMLANGISENILEQGSRAN